MSPTSRVGLLHLAARSAGTTHYTDMLVKVRVLCRVLLAVCARTANAVYEKKTVFSVPVNERSTKLEASINEEMAPLKEKRAAHMTDSRDDPGATGLEGELLTSHGREREHCPSGSTGQTNGGSVRKMKAGGITALGSSLRR